MRVISLGQESLSVGKYFLPMTLERGIFDKTCKSVLEHVIPFFAFPPDVRRVIYTTNVIESLHMQLRKIIKARGHFPSDDAAIKLLWLALRNIMDGKIRSTGEWKMAMNQFAVLYGDRFISPKN